jgi:ubiquinone/menaquinone biosynthesis C-methylase UbiE
VAAAADFHDEGVGDDPMSRRTTIDLLPSGVVARVRTYADIGAGWGRFTKWMSYELKLPKQQVFAVDQYTDKRAAKNITYIAGDAHALPFRDGEIDLVGFIRAVVLPSMHASDAVHLGHSEPLAFKFSRQHMLTI